MSFFNFFIPDPSSYTKSGHFYPSPLRPSVPLYFHFECMHSHCQWRVHAAGSAPPLANSRALRQPAAAGGQLPRPVLPARRRAVWMDGTDCAECGRRAHHAEVAADTRPRTFPARPPVKLRRTSSSLRRSLQQASYCESLFKEERRICLTDRCRRRRSARRQ